MSTTTTLKSPSRKTSANDSPELREIDTLCTELKNGMATAVDRALRIGIHLLSIHGETVGDDDGGFRAALDRIETHSIPRATAYRWLNAAGRFLARHQDVADPNGEFMVESLIIPKRGSQEFREIENAIGQYGKISSLRRLMLGSAATGEESRMDTLIEAAEHGDPIADEILDRVAKGELTLVQAIRARAGTVACKNKTRKDPVYLDIDGATGQCRGLFVRSLVTISNAFDHWPQLDETARQKAKSAWKALVAKIPNDLR